MRQTAILIAMALLVLLVLAQPLPAQDIPGTDITLDDIPDLSGDTLTLDVEEVDIRTLLRLLAQSRHMNIVAGPEVQGSVSINLFEVPFDEAIEAILGVGGYTSYNKGDIVYVTTEAAKLSMPMRSHDMRIRVYEVRHAALEEVEAVVNQFLSQSGKAVVDKGMIIVEDAPDYLERIDALIESLDVPPSPVEIFEINHAVPQEVLDTLTPLLSPGGTATLSSENKIVVRDAPDYMVQVQEMIASLDSRPRQVLISARILNITLEDNMSLGVEFESSSIVNPVGAALDPTAPLLNNFRRDITSLTTGQAGIFSLIIRDHENAIIEALSTKGKVETLSAPQLLTLDGELAKIQVGERLGFRITTTTQTSSLESVEFLEVGTVLDVTPKISSDGLIQMELHPEVSTGNINGDGLPAKRTTEATTTVIVADGETILIGGLVNATKQRTRSGVPGLSKIPVLGQLFGRRTYTDNKSELVILVTPRLVQTEASEDMFDRIERVGEAEKTMARDRADFSRLVEGEKSMKKP